MAERGLVLAAEALGGKGPDPFPPGTAGSLGVAMPGPRNLSLNPVTPPPCSIMSDKTQGL